MKGLKYDGNTIQGPSGVGLKRSEINSDRKQNWFQILIPKFLFLEGG